MNTSASLNITSEVTTEPSVSVKTGNQWDDATWILTSSFIIFTMQSGFGLLESGAVSHKNEVNIMFKNAIDVVFGGISYWLFGYGLSFGDGSGSNPFCGVGHFALDIEGEKMGEVYSNFIFQLSFATTATTIVSGAMAERTKLSAYLLFSFFNTLVYCFPAHWIWGNNGFLRMIGVVDIAGSGAVHLVGGTSALVAAFLLGPRLGRYENGTKALPLGNPTNALVGMFMLWWGWLGFNCGSTYGISGGKWKLAAKSAATTLSASIGGGICSCAARAAASTINSSMAGGSMGMLTSYVRRSKKFDVSDLVTGILGGLVAITASCAVVRPWESLLIGAIGALISIFAVALMDRLRLDDPVGATAVHGIAGIWGMIAVGLFVEIDTLEDMTMGRAGLFKSGSAYLLGVQALACACVIVWSGALSFTILKIIQKTIGLRLSQEEEILGSDFVEHDIAEWGVVSVVASRGVGNAGNRAMGSTTLIHRQSFPGTRKNSSRRNSSAVVPFTIGVNMDVKDDNISVINLDNHDCNKQNGSKTELIGKNMLSV